MTEVCADRLFGIPFALCDIDPTSYNKRELIRDIKSNYRKNPNRDEWSGPCKMHHAYNDWDNQKYIQSNYSQLIKVYEKVIGDCLITFNFKENFTYNFKIVNYNCMSGGGYMDSHSHPEVPFVGIHYIQFDPECHISTEYINMHPYAEYQNMKGLPQMEELLGSKDYYTSGYSKTWRLPVKEDSFCLTPGFLQHRVPVHPDTSKLRMAIIVNIDVRKTDALLK